MQATALGRYLLYRPDRHVRRRPGRRQRRRRPTRPSPAADWRVDDAGSGTFTLTPASGGAADAARRALPRPRAAAPSTPRPSSTRPARPSRARPATARVGGLVEGHMHWMTYRVPRRPLPLRPARGTATASRSRCPTARRSRGRRASRRRSRTSSTTAIRPSRTTPRGWPTLASWRPTNLTYEGTYWRWIERAWIGGLRLMVMSLNENRVLCVLQANRQTNCDEMDTVRRSLEAIQRAPALRRRAGRRPRQGLLPDRHRPRTQARRVINQGRMAVVLEVEVSEPFGCSGCGPADVRPGAGRPPSSTSCIGSACARCCC